MIIQSFMKIKSHLNDILPLYGYSIARKSSVLYNVQFISPDFQSKMSFSQNLVFFNSMEAIVTEYGKEKNLKKIFTCLKL